jgi:hypothetical protein
MTAPLNLSMNAGEAVNATIDTTSNGTGMTLPGGTIGIGPARMDIRVSQVVED